MNTSSVSIHMSIANFRTQMLSSLMDLGSDSNSSFADIVSGLQVGGGKTALTGNSGMGANPGSAVAGFNMALNDPMSAYTMMTRINVLDVTYKAQYSELSNMDAYLPRLADAARQLGNTAIADSDDSIKAKLEDFIQQYNAWVQRFRSDVQPSGVLAQVQAGELPLYELDQVVESRFIGAKNGLNGLADLGISIDASTGLLSVNTGQFDAALKNNRQALVDAIGEFTVKFAAEANLLASDDNLIQHRLDNLGGAIAYIDGNVGSWRKEFGSGDAAHPTGSIAQALAAYNNAKSV